MANHTGVKPPARPPLERRLRAADIPHPTGGNFISVCAAKSGGMGDQDGPQ